MYARGGPRPPAGTLCQLFFDAVERYRKPDALMVRVNGRYQPISHATVLERVRRVSLGLRAMGVSRGDRVLILSENRPEWAIADYACLTGGMTDVPIYPTLPAEQIPHILNDAGVVALFVSNEDQTRKIAQIRSQVPPGQHSDPLLADALERLARARERLAGLRARVPEPGTTE